MKVPELREGQEVGRGWAPADDNRLPEWNPGPSASVLVRRGRRSADGSWFVRVDYEPGRAAEPGARAVSLDLLVRRLDPVTKAEGPPLVNGTFALEAVAGGVQAVEFWASPGQPESRAPGSRGPEADWVRETFSDPRDGRCSPVRLEMRFRPQPDGPSDPPAGSPPYRVVLNTAQVRNRANVRQHTAAMGAGQQVVSLFYTNPDAQGLGVLKRIQPPYTPVYQELTSDLRLFWEYRVPAGGHVNLHRHQTEEIWHVTEGEGTFIQDGEEQVIRAGDSIIIYPGSWHGLRADRGDFTFLVIDVGAARSNQPH